MGQHGPQVKPTLFTTNLKWVTMHTLSSVKYGAVLKKIVNYSKAFSKRDETRTYFVR